MFRNVHPGVYVLVLLFGISSWVDINGLWVELPILVQELPEGWTLPSYIVVITQIGNIGTVIYGALCSTKLKERNVIFLVLSAGVAASVALVFSWKHTVFIFGAFRSVPLFIINLVLALVDCTSTVICYPFLATLKPPYMTAYFTGEGVGSLLSGLLGIAQGAGTVHCTNVTINHTTVTNDASSSFNMSYVLEASYGDNNFSLEVFFLIIAGVMSVSGVAYSILVLHPSCQSEYVKGTKSTHTEYDNMAITNKSYHLETKDDQHEADDVHELKVTVTDIALSVEAKAMDCNNGSRSVSQYDNMGHAGENGTSIKEDSLKCVGIKNNSLECSGVIDNSPGVNVSKVEVDPEDKDVEVLNEVKERNQTSSLSTLQYAVTLMLTGWITSLQNSVLISVQSYSCLPYGVTTYHLAVNLANLANPIACFCNLFIKVTSVPMLCFLSLIGSLLGGYIMVTAASSPKPWLVATTEGSALIIITWVAVAFLLMTVKVSLASLFRGEGKKGMLHCGVATQIGSCLGGILMFLLVNVLQMFTSSPQCQ